MALYDGDMVNLLTPDGRAVTMPSGLAANFPGLLPPPAPASLPPGPPPDQAGNPPPAAPPIAAAAAPLVTPGPPQEGPVTDPSQLPPATGAPSIPQGPVTTPAEDAGPPRRPAPEPSPTKAQLVKEGPAGTLAAQNAAVDAQQAAIDRSAQVEADAATQEGHAMAQRDVQTQQILAERAKQAAANEAELNARVQARDQLADQIAKTRIDRTVDHPIWSQLGLILSMVGTAMTRRPGEAWNDPAYNTLQQLLDKKVAGQMQDLDQKRLSLAQMNVGVQEQRQHNVDRLTEIDARKDAAIQQAQQAVQTIAMQMKSPAALAKAAETNAILQEKRADLRGQAAQRYQDQMNVEATRAQSERHFRAQMGLEYKKMAIEQQDKMAALAERLIEKGDAKAAQRAKDVGERAVFDPRTGDVQLNEAGQTKMQQADRYEAAARQSQDPQQVAKLRQAASDLRDSARLNDGVLAPDKATADKVRPALGAAQGMVDQIGEATRILDAGPSAFNREAWAGLKTTLGDLAKNYAAAADERVTVKGIENAMENIISFDPDSSWDREASKGKAMAALASLKNIVRQQADRTLKDNGIKSNWLPLDKRELPGETKLDLDEKTAREISDDRELGFSRIEKYTTSANEDAKREAENDALARGGEAGLSPIATQHIQALTQKAVTVGDREHDQIVGQLAAHIEDGFRDGGRDSVAWGMINVIGDQDPRVLNDVLVRLPKQDAELVRKMRAGRQAPPSTVPGKGSGFDLEALDRQRVRDEEARQAAQTEKFRSGGPWQNSPGAGTPQGIPR